MIFTDSVFGAPARWVAAKASTGAPSWLYHFSYVAEDARATGKRAGHASEIPYVFKMKLSIVGNIGPNDEFMGDLMNTCWSTFIKTGAPQCGSGWPAYTPDGDQLMEFGVGPGGVVMLGKLPQRVHERFRDVSSAVGAESALSVGNGWRGGRHMIIVTTL